MKKFMGELNKVYKENKAFYEIDFSSEGFEWIDFRDSDNSIISFARKSKDSDEIVVCAFNFTPVVRKNYRIGVPKQGYYTEIFNTDAVDYWGSNVGNYGGVWSEELAWQGKSNSINITLPPLGGVFFKLKN